MVNYYEKLNLSRDLNEQKKFLECYVKELGKRCVLYRKECEKNNTKIVVANEESDLFAVDELKKKLEQYQKEIMLCEKAINKINNVLSLRANVNLEKKENDDKGLLLLDEVIGMIYFQIRCVEENKRLKRKYNDLLKLPDLEEKQHKISDLEDKIRELDNATKIFTNVGRKGEYDLKLKQYLYLENLKRDREARIMEEKKYVHKVLRDDFELVPYRAPLEQLEGAYRWKVREYDQPKVFFIGKSNYRDLPQIDQNIYAYEYGTFGYETILKENGKAVFSDNCCKIVGITKKAADGSKTTDFVILHMQEPRNFDSAVQEKIANIFFSDYLIDNAVKNNSHYLGTFSIQHGVEYLEIERLEACSVALAQEFYKKSSGKQENERAFENQIINGINGLFEKFEIMQKKLVEDAERTKDEKDKVK